MLNIAKDIDSLSNFKRKTAEYMKRMKRSGHPLVLTVNGKPELVVMDPAAYQKMAEDLERVKTIEAIRAGYEDAKAGRTRSAQEVHAEMRKRYEIPD